MKNRPEAGDYSNTYQENYVQSAYNQEHGSEHSCLKFNVQIRGDYKTNDTNLTQQIFVLARVTSIRNFSRWNLQDTPKLSACVKSSLTNPEYCLFIFPTSVPLDET